MDVIIWGGTGQCKIVANILECDGHNVIAVFDDSDPLPPAPLNVPLYNGTHYHTYLDGLRQHKHDLVGLIVAVGNPNGKFRLNKTYLETGIRAVRLNAIHTDTAILSPIPDHCGLQVSCGAHIGCEVFICDCVIINSMANIEHDCHLGTACEIGPSAVVCGEVKIGDYSWIGAGAVVRDHLTIGKNSIIGCGSVVVNDIPDNEVWVGNPARKLRDNDIR